ncbi:epoxide hydrolase 2 [Fusarium langsethiae]|uniref:Epoxide hydrolase 2 n=1 Tax=Fusarium langsethiae TaxID=179993 RepID=A0A0N0V4R9_FUSLA|nr:epoxide hydrolase 2 [Fusarium langsethiae]GKU09954.1 unnamed protein product [Fusarium langsethiae]GKU11852.1 unnamed protein product [Fusarium langsethiae]
MMDVSHCNKKTLKVSRGFEYTYYTSPAKDFKPTLLLFHGWPDTAHLWSGLINKYLIPNGYGVVALDCLGYGETSKPTDVEAYAWQHMTADSVEILDAENLTTVISMGHDWGSTMCQRFYNFYPDRVCGLVMVNVTYMEPAGTFDLDQVNEITKKAFGAGIFEYWHFFTAPDAPEMMSKNLESVYTVAHGEPGTWLENWCTPGGMRRYISEGRTQAILPYAQGDHKADFLDRFSDKHSFEAANSWYKAFTTGVQNKADRLIANEAKTVKVPTLYWGGEDDFVCRPAGLQPSVNQGLLPKAKSVTRKGGHWALLERPDEFGRDILSWLQETY